MERILKATFMSHLENNNLLTKEQHGFSKKKNCCTNLIEFMDPITQAMEDNLPVDIIFLDMKKAFDSVPHNRLCLKLKSYGFNKKAVRWCKNFVSNRVQRVVCNGGFSNWSPVTSGVPQGSVLGPFMFIVYINDLPNELSTNCKMYADDIKLINIIRSSSDIEKTQTDLNKLMTWSQLWLLIG